MQRQGIRPHVATGQALGFGKADAVTAPNILQPGKLASAAFVFLMYTPYRPAAVNVAINSSICAASGFPSVAGSMMPCAAKRVRISTGNPPTYSRRAGPCLLFHRLRQKHHVAPRRDPWYAKKEVTFSDALAAVRRLCWSEVLIKPWNHAGVTKLPRRLRLTPLDQLCRAA
jgi:hypothetical protein